LVSLAQRTALAIENARLYEQAQQVATLEEPSAWLASCTMP